MIAAGNDAQFQRLCEALGQPGLASDPRFATNADRFANKAALVSLVEDVTLRRTAAEWVAVIGAAGVPCGPVNDIAQVFDDPQIRHRGMRVEVAHPTAGPIPLIANPVRLSETPIEYRTAPPLLGQHTREILRELLAMGDADIDRLARDGVI